MEEVKITVSEDLYNKLSDDMMLFNYTDKSKNEFYTKVIINTYDLLTYEERIGHIRTILTDVLGEKFISSFSKPKQDEIARNINQQIQGKIFKEKASRKIYIRPNSKQATMLDEIIIENNNQASSTTFRNILSEYVALPQYVREQILFKDNYEKMKKALKTGRQIQVKTANGNRVMDLYGLIKGKEEFHTYVVGFSQDRNDMRTIWSIKLCSIESVLIMNTALSITQDEIREAEEKSRQNPAFISGEYAVVNVRFTEYGKELYNLLYKDRPRIKEKNGDIYTFECSVFQLTNYLKAFGNSARVLDNENIKRNLKQFFSDALNAYSD